MKAKRIILLIVAAVLGGCASNPACWSGLEGAGDKSCIGDTFVLKHKVKEAFSWEGEK